MDVCALPYFCAYWESNMGPMQEKYVPSIMSYQVIQYQAISYYQNNFTISGLARDMTIEGFPGPRKCPQF